MKVHPRHYADMASLYRGGSTFKEIGKRFGVSRERVRQHNAALMQRLRAGSQRQPLARFGA